MTFDLRHGDCIEGMRGMDDKSVDHVICDPPYDEHTHRAQRRGATGKDKTKGLSSTSVSMERYIGFPAITTAEMDACAREFSRVCKRWILVFCSMEQQHAWMTLMERHGLNHVRFGIWSKPGSTPQFTGDRPGTGCEAIEIAHPPGRKRWNGGGGFGLWTVPIVKEQTGVRVHPTQKPLALMEALVRDFTDPGDLILDPFAGSGTTGVAAIRLGRRFVGWERDPKYHAIATKRLSVTREQLGLFAGGA